MHPWDPNSAAALTEPIARPARLCTQMPAKARTAPELLQEEAKVFERLVALCATYGLPPQVPRFIANGVTESSVLRVMRAAAPRNSVCTRTVSDTMAEDLLDAVNAVRKAQSAERSGASIKPIGDIDSLVRNVLSNFVPVGDVAAFASRAAELGIELLTVPGRTRYTPGPLPRHAAAPRSSLCRVPPP